MSRQHKITVAIISIAIAVGIIAIVVYRRRNATRSQAEFAANNPFPPESIAGLSTWDIQQAINRADAIKLNKEQLDSIYQLVEMFRKYGDNDLRKLAYILATSNNETRFRWNISEQRAKPGTTVYNMQEKYFPSGYYGRGLSQLTWKGNYEKFGKLLGRDFVTRPDEVKYANIGAEILVRGMLGPVSFTRDTLSDYINDTTTDYLNARNTTNTRLFGAEYIRSKAELYDKALRQANAQTTV